MKALAFALLSLLAALFGIGIALAFRSWQFGLVATGFMLAMAWDVCFGDDDEKAE